MLRKRCSIMQTGVGSLSEIQTPATWLGCLVAGRGIAGRTRGSAPTHGLIVVLDLASPGGHGGPPPWRRNVSHKLRQAAIITSLRYCMDYKMKALGIEAKKAYFAKTRRSNYVASLRLEGYDLQPSVASGKAPSRATLIKQYSKART